jgi:uncharacterized protein involved in outer membrane biogenesis
VLRWLVRIAIAIGITLLLIVLGVAGALLVGIRVSLDPLRGELEAAASTALDRRLVLEGPIEIVPSLWPTFEVGGVRVANPRHWPEGDVLRAELARVRIAVLPLLRGGIRVLELTAQGLDLELERRAPDDVNWAFGAPEEPASDEPVEGETRLAPEQPPPDAARPILVHFVGVDEISLDEIRVRYREPGEEPEELEIARLEGAVTFDEPLHVEGEGSVRREPYAFAVDAGSPRSILVERGAWPLDLSLEVAGATLSLSGRAEGRFPADAPRGERVVPVGIERLEVELSLRSERLDRFDGLLGVALPPSAPWSLRAGWRRPRARRRSRVFGSASAPAI